MSKYDFPTIRRGDYYNGTEFTLTLNGSPVDLTNATIAMDMRLTPDGASEKRFETGGNGITIQSPATGGVFNLDGQIIDVENYGNFHYDIQITFPNGSVKTWIWGNWNIAEDITHDD